LLAVADGMGGHAAGEVASAATIEAISALDVDDPTGDLLAALANAVTTANLRLQEMILSDPATEGMGTTLTALLWADGQAALCHIGDSRAYLLRDGQFYQITHDHTLVQSLVDEGRITEDDVATHPQRSLLLRALDGRTLADPDLSTHETMAGDRYLLCSDGLSGVVTEQTMHQALSSVRDPDKAALQLVELALKGGGPDNITCIVADVIDLRNSGLQPTRVPVMAGAASAGAPRPAARQSSPATRANRLRKTAPQPALNGRDDGEEWSGGGDDGGMTGHFQRPDTTADAPPAQRGSHRARPRPDDDDDYGDRASQGAKRRWPIVTTLLVVLVLALGGGAFGTWQYIQSSYFLGINSKGNVAIFRGVNTSLFGIKLYSQYQDAGVPTAQLGARQLAALRATVGVPDLSTAQKSAADIKIVVSQCQAGWIALADWKSQNDAYQTKYAAYKTQIAHLNKRQHPPAAPTPPGPQPPAPTANNCAGPAAFGIAASSLPPGAGGPTTPAVSTQPTPTHSASASPSAGASVRPSASAAGSKKP
jgi:protein phosphatase